MQTTKLTDQDFELLAAIASGAATFDTPEKMASLKRLREKYLVSKKGVTASKYGRERLERHQTLAGHQAALLDSSEKRRARRSEGVSDAGLKLARDEGYSPRLVDDEWFVINNRTSHPVHGAGGGRHPSAQRREGERVLPRRADGG
jgi:hypothetical protein